MAEDITHDVFLQTYKHAARIDKMADPVAYIMVSTRNHSYNMLKRENRTTDLQDDIIDNVGSITFEKAIQESLENIQAAPSKGLRSRVMENADRGIEIMPVHRRSIPLKAAVLAAVVAALVLTTAFTFGNEIVSIIRQVMFGDSIAKQVVSDNSCYLGYLGVMNIADLSDANDYPLGLFYTFEEARKVAPFPIREPSFLPDSVTGPNSIGVWRAEAETGPWTHFVIVAYDIALVPDGNSILQLTQFYAGPDAYFDIESVSKIEKVMVGDVEAVLVTTDGKSDFGEGNVITNVSDTGYALYWLKFGIAFELSVDYHNGYTPETMIRIAESISEDSH